MNLLKKILILFLSAHLCAAENIKKPDLQKSKDTSARMIGLGLAVWVAYTILPNLLEDSNNCMATLVGLALWVYSFSQLRSSHVNTDKAMHTEAQKMSPSEAHEIHTRLTAKRELRTCLLNNMYNKQRNSSGLPTECEQPAHMYSLVAGEPALDEMIEAFNICWN